MRTLCATAMASSAFRALACGSHMGRSSLLWPSHMRQGHRKDITGSGFRLCGTAEKSDSKFILPSKVLDPSHLRTIRHLKPCGHQNGPHRVRGSEHSQSQRLPHGHQLHSQPLSLHPSYLRDLYPKECPRDHLLSSLPAFHLPVPTKHLIPKGSISSLLWDLTLCPEIGLHLTRPALEEPHESISWSLSLRPEFQFEAQRRHQPPTGNPD